ncbi:MAG: hypothetical protein ACD_72C00526G0004 [uncultured bacterium]|nr:MAG: hypothetical protein ACD_72C00526G0004 [uncultured bacterium]
MITALNLLSDHKKIKLEKLLLFIFCKKLLEIIILVATFIATILLLSWYVVQEQFNSLTQSALLVNKEFSSYNQNIREVNTNIRQLNLSAQNFATISDKLINLAQLMPSGIKLNSLEIDRRTGTFIISGLSKTRDGLLTYQEQIKQYGWIVDAQTPTSQLFQKENTSFEIHAKIKNIPLLEPIKATPSNRTNNQE